MLSPQTTSSASAASAKSTSSSSSRPYSRRHPRCLSERANNEENNENDAVIEIEDNNNLSDITSNNDGNSGDNICSDVCRRSPGRSGLAAIVTPPSSTAVNDNNVQKTRRRDNDNDQGGSSSSSSSSSSSKRPRLFDGGEDELPTPPSPKSRAAKKAAKKAERERQKVQREAKAAAAAAKMAAHLAALRAESEKKKQEHRENVEAAAAKIAVAAAKEGMSVKDYLLAKEEAAAAERQQKIAAAKAAKVAAAKAMRHKALSDIMAKLQKLSVKVEDETDERLKLCYELGRDECDALIDDLALAMEENNDNGKSFDRIEKQLRYEYSLLDDIDIESISKYRINLRRRKTDRGRADNEKTRMVTQQLLNEKKQFDDMAKVANKSIEEEFGDNLEFMGKLKQLIIAVADPNRDCSDVAIEGQLGGFKVEDASAIALEQIKLMLELAVEELGLESIKDILPNGMDLEQFVTMFEGENKLDAMKTLEQLALNKAKKDGTPLLNEGKIEERDHLLLGTNSFLSSYGINISYDDARRCLVDGQAGSIRHPTTNEPMTFLRVGNVLHQQDCIGKRKQAGGKLDDFNTASYIDGNYVLRVFGGGKYPCLYKVNGNEITRVKFRAHVADNLLSFRCVLKRDKTQASEQQFASDEKQWTLHRLTQVVLHNHGRGMIHNELLREHYGLKDGETFEDKVNYYDYNPEAAKKRRARLIAKGWEGVGQASWCDYDHLLKRTRVWMNASIFTMPCSHSWNSCMAKIRQRMGCWGFGFAYIKYNGGN